jgi:hypothetical protein
MSGQEASEYDTKVYWVKLKCGKWVVAEKRFFDRWFIPGCGSIMGRRAHPHQKSYEISEVGDEVVCPHT